MTYKLKLINLIKMHDRGILEICGLKVYSTINVVTITIIPISIPTNDGTYCDELRCDRAPFCSKNLGIGYPICSSEVDDIRYHRVAYYELRNSRRLFLMVKLARIFRDGKINRNSR